MKKVFAVSILAILATGAANADIASKAYVDQQTADMATQAWVEEQNYLTEHQSLDGYAKTETVTSAVDAAKQELNEAIDAKADAADLSKYQTIENMNAGKLSADSTSTYASEKTVSDAIAEAVKDVASSETISGLQDSVSNLESKLSSEHFKGEKGVNVNVTDDGVTVSGVAASESAVGVVKPSTGLNIDGEGTLTVDMVAVAGELAKDQTITDAIQKKLQEEVENGSVNDAIESAISNALGDYQTALDAGNGIDGDAFESGTVQVKAADATINVGADGIKVPSGTFVTPSGLNDSLKTYETIEGAAGKYQEKGEYLTETSLEGYAKSTDLSAYQQKSTLDNDVSTLGYLKEAALGDYVTNEDKAELEGKISAAQSKAEAADTAAQTAQSTADEAKTTAAAAIPKPNPNTCSNTTDGCVLKFINNNYSWEPIAGAGAVTK